MAELPRTTVKWMNDKGEEVRQSSATNAIVTEYDEKGRVTRETHGTLSDEEVEEPDGK